MGRVTQYVECRLRPSPRRQRLVFGGLAVLGMIGVVARPGVVTVDRELGFVFVAAIAFFPRMLSRLGEWNESHRLRAVLLDLAVFWCFGFGVITYLLPAAQAILVVVPLGVVTAGIGYVVERRRTGN